jgi:hypothetical protein
VARSEEHRVSLDGGQVVEHTVPMTVLLTVLEKWHVALKEALPKLVEHLQLSTEAAREVCDSVEPLATAVKEGSVEQPWSYGVASPGSLAPTMFLTDQVLNNLADTFEDGVSRLQAGEVAAWMTPKVAKPVLDTVKFLGKRGISLKLTKSKAVLAETARKTLANFIRQDEHEGKAEIQVFGNVASVSGKDGYFTLSSTAHGHVRATFGRSHRAELCRALSEDLPVEAVVLATLSSDKVLENANLRTVRVLRKQPDYRKVLAEVWGSGREMFAGVPHDERGVPDPDPDPELN